MGKNFIKSAITAVAFALVAGCIFPLFASEASANSAYRYYRGMDSSGAIIRTDENSIKVNREDLTFDIYAVNDGVLYEPRMHGYFGKVTAKYEFYNVADHACEVDVVFPFGASYKEEGDNKESAERRIGAVKVNGADIEKTVRHTYQYDYYDFDIEEELKNFCDDFKTTGRYKPDETVYKYTVTLNCEEDAPDEKVVRFAFGKRDPKKFFYDYDKYEKTDGAVYVEKVVKGNVFEFAFVAEDELSPASLIEVYEPYSDNGIGKKISATPEVSAKEKTTFKDFVLSFKSEDSPVSDVDYFNATVDKLTKNSEPVLNSEALSPGDRLMQWYEYSLSFAPGETLVNEVTVPMYPDFNAESIPEIVVFKYLLSPAKTWVDFKDLYIKVNTDMYIINNHSTNVNFTNTEYGYEAYFSHLPEEELSFGLCTSPSPVSRNRNEYNTRGVYIDIALIIFLLSVIIGPILFVIGLVLIIKARKSKKKRAEVLASDAQAETAGNDEENKE